MASLAEKSIKFCCQASEKGLPVSGDIGTQFFPNWSMLYPQQS